MTERLLGFMETFSSLFIFYRKGVSEKARQYLSGAMLAGTRKNMARMLEYLPDSDHQALHQFKSNTRLDAQAVMDRVAVNADNFIGDYRKACLPLDESRFDKKGRHSAGAVRQQLGNLGKLHNGEVVVSSALCNQG